MKMKRRSLISKLLATGFGVVGFKWASAFASTSDQKESFEIDMFQQEPLFAGYTRLGNLVFIAGTGADDASVHEIKQDTDFVLKKMEKRLIAAGSSMNKVLKVTVFLDDLADFDGMNEVYKGRFGENPPVRSTVAVAKGGIPGGSILEIECIAYM